MSPPLIWLTGKSCLQLHNLWHSIKTHILWLDAYQCFKHLFLLHWLVLIMFIIIFIHLGGRSLFHPVLAGIQSMMFSNITSNTFQPDRINLTIWVASSRLISRFQTWAWLQALVGADTQALLSVSLNVLHASEDASYNPPPSQKSYMNKLWLFLMQVVQKARQVGKLSVVKPLSHFSAVLHLYMLLTFKAGI